MREAVFEALAASETAAARRALRIRGAVVLDKAEYAPLARLLT
jgi:hypothetical protein